MDQAYSKGLMLYRMKRYAQALTEFKRVLETDPNNAGALANAALCHSQLKQYVRARQCAEAAIRADPEHAEGHYALGWVFCRDDQFECGREGEPGGRMRLARAGTAIDEALRLKPCEVRYLAARAMICLNELNVRGALEAAEKALVVDPKNGDALRFRALALRTLGDLRGAQAAAREALENEPASAHSHCVAGWACLSGKQYLKGRGHFLEAVRIDPTLEAARMGLLEALRCGIWIYPRVRPWRQFLSRGFRIVWLRLLVMPQAICMIAFLVFGLGLYDATWNELLSTPPKPVPPEIHVVPLFVGVGLFVCSPHFICMMLGLVDFGLLFDPIGRRLLTGRQRFAACTSVALVLMIAVVAVPGTGVMGLITGGFYHIFVAAMFGLSAAMIPVASELIHPPLN